MDKTYEDVGRNLHDTLQNNCTLLSLLCYQSDLRCYRHCTMDFTILLFFYFFVAMFFWWIKIHIKSEKNCHWISRPASFPVSSNPSRNCGVTSDSTYMTLFVLQNAGVCHEHCARNSTAASAAASTHLYCLPTTLRAVHIVFRFKMLSSSSPSSVIYIAPTTQRTQTNTIVHQ